MEQPKDILSAKYICTIKLEDTYITGNMEYIIKLQVKPSDFEQWYGLPYIFALKLIKGCSFTGEHISYLRHLNISGEGDVIVAGGWGCEDSGVRVEAVDKGENVFLRSEIL